MREQPDASTRARRPFDWPFGRAFTFVDPDGYTITAHEQ
jgi:predicted enzyme related to lactoylglutathione lyase